MAHSTSRQLDVARRVLARAAAQVERPAVAALLAGVVYLAVAAGHRELWRGSPYPYFNSLADAFLHGQLGLRAVPEAHTHDLSPYQGQWYLYWPPMPAVVLLPYVALFGVKASDVAFTALLGAANVAAVAWLLRLAAVRGFRLRAFQRGALVCCFAFGTVHFTLAPFGRVWFTAQVVGFLFLTLCYCAALHRSGWLRYLAAGAALSAAMLTRNHMAFAGLWPAYFLLRSDRLAPVSRWLTRAALGLLPVALGLALTAWYNHARFGSALENGLTYHQVGVEFLADYRVYGAFHPHYLGANLYYQYLYYPYPLGGHSYMGGSLLLMTPVFFGAFFAFRRRATRSSAVALAVSAGLVAVPILLLMGTGFVQLGPRYTLDFTVPLLLLTALGIRRWRPLWLGAAVLISVTHYTLGALHFMRFL